MAQLLNVFHGAPCLSQLGSFDHPGSAVKLLQHKSCCSIKNSATIRNFHGAWEYKSPVKASVYDKAFFSGEGSGALPHVQTLREFPRDELAAKVVMVRFDSTILLQEEVDQRTYSHSRAIFTIRYLYEAGAKVILASDWSEKVDSKLLAHHSVADFLSSVLQYRIVPLKSISNNVPVKKEGLEKADIFLLENLAQFKEEAANCSNFAELLSSKVDILVNDSFSQSHKLLASTVAISRFCYACLAGFHFEESLYLLKKAAETNEHPYFAIIGGGKFSNNAPALRFLASRCDGLIFVGMMSFQIMHVLGLSVPSDLVEHRALSEALDIIQVASARSIPILFPKDLWCMNDRIPGKFELFSVQDILEGWSPVDLGPKSLDNIYSLLTNCKKILWIGPSKFRTSGERKANGSSQLGKMLYKLSKSNCDITAVGKMACKAMMEETGSIHTVNMVENASVMWEFFKGRKLPGVLALDRAYPFKIDWHCVYHDPGQPLAVDIGSGNGLFIFGMAKMLKALNYLGLEINEKLVSRCQDTVHQSGIQNGYFIATNATSTFRSIVSTYPGELVLVSIQLLYMGDVEHNVFSLGAIAQLCPNPDFNKPNHRWRMLQRSLIEAIADLLAPDGKVFLQSDVEAVAVRMKEQFLKYSKSKLMVSHQELWLDVNPFGVRSDWEHHVLDRGAPMYRMMLCKVDNDHVNLINPRKERTFQKRESFNLQRPCSAALNI